MEIAAYILAGGNSSRMGADKAAVTLGGLTLAQIAFDKVRPLCSSVTILRGTKNAPLIDGCEHLNDLRPNAGPVGGIEAALAHTRCEWNLIVAVDAPLVPVDLMRRWLGDATTRTGLASILISAGVEQPLPLLIHRDAMPLVAKFLQSGKRSVWQMLESCKLHGRSQVVRIPADTYQVSVPIRREHWFLNANHPADLQLAEWIWEQTAVNL